MGQWVRDPWDLPAGLFCIAVAPIFTAERYWED